MRYSAANTPNYSSFMIALISAFLAVVFAYVVYLTDGTNRTFPHLMYIPIIFSALLGNWYVSMGIALWSGFLVSHWVMPLSVSQQTPQEPFQSLFRMAIFLIISYWTKTVYEHQRERIQVIDSERIALHKIQQDSLSALIDLAETRDGTVTGQHLRRLKEYSRILAEELPVEPGFKEMLANTIGFHDIGKVAVRDSILTKPGPLDPEEWEEMKQHTVAGANIFQKLEDTVEANTSSRVKQFLHMAKDITLYHHERVDGTGYPEQLKGEEIPLSARVAAICDVYDALRSERPYKRPMSHEEAVQIIVEGRGTHFDPELVDLFLKKQLEFKEVFDRSCDNTRADDSYESASAG